MNPTEILLLVVWPAICFGIGVWAGPGIRKALRRNKVVTTKLGLKPDNEFSDYTIDELEAYKKYAQKEYADSINYPYLRQGHAESLKKVLDMLEWHYTKNGTRDLEEQRARNKRELEHFDEMYAAALKGNR